MISNVRFFKANVYSAGSVKLSLFRIHRFVGPTNHIRTKSYLFRCIFTFDYKRVKVSTKAIDYLIELEFKLENY